jgi:hypothetical protein
MESTSSYDNVEGAGEGVRIEEEVADDASETCVTAESGMMDDDDAGVDGWYVDGHVSQKWWWWWYEVWSVECRVWRSNERKVEGLSGTRLKRIWEKSDHDTDAVLASGPPSSRSPLSYSPR